MTQVITCEDCGKLNKGKEQGNSWICEDCKEGGEAINDSSIEPETG
jgi:ribosomal protein L37AE/L43A